MQVVIFCGGKATRLRPYTDELPKALIQIGDRPILWHLMKVYSQHGHKDFILCLGYMGNMIKQYFQIPENRESDWNITFVDTGENSSKTERLMKVKDFIKEDNFLAAYGDDLSNVNINDVVKFHLDNKKIVTLTAVNPMSQFGILELDGNEVKEFKEKPKLDHWTNGGYFVFNKKIFDYLRSDWELENEVFEKLVGEKQIAAFKHPGVWMTMNTLKDAIELNELWKSGELKKILYHEET